MESRFFEHQKQKKSFLKNWVVREKSEVKLLWETQGRVTTSGSENQKSKNRDSKLFHEGKPWCYLCHGTK